MGLCNKDDNLIYKTNYMGFWIKVYPDRIDFKSGAGRQSVPITQIASIKQSLIGFMRITIETTGGKKYKIPTLHKQAVQDAIYEAQAQK